MQTPPEEETQKNHSKENFEFENNDHETRVIKMKKKISETEETEEITEELILEELVLIGPENSDDTPEKKSKSRRSSNYSQNMSLQASLMEKQIKDLREDLDNNNKEIHNNHQTIIEQKKRINELEDEKNKLETENRRFPVLLKTEVEKVKDYYIKKNEKIRIGFDELKNIFSNVVEVVVNLKTEIDGSLGKLR